MTSLALGATIEIIPDERGKEWENPREFTVDAPCGEKLTVPKGFVHDRYSFAPDTNDNLPAIAHDRAYAHRRWDSGKRIRLVCQFINLAGYIFQVLFGSGNLPVMVKKVAKGILHSGNCFSLLICIADLNIIKVLS